MPILPAAVEPGTPLQLALQQVSGTTLDMAGAANAWAGTVGLELVGALNAQNGTTDLELAAVLEALGFPMEGY